MTAKNKLGVFDLTMIVVSLVIGMGIFRTPANVAAASPTPFLFYLCWIMGGVVALCGALTYAEIGSRLPVTGGYYKVFSYAYHPSIAFAINCLILVSNAASGSGVALIGSEYISSVLFPGETDTAFLLNAQILIALGAIAIFYLVNMLGLRMSSRTQNVLMIVKICLVLLLVTPLFLGDHHAAATAADAVSPVTPAFREYLKAFGIGLVAVSFTFGGYQQSINFGAEVERPNRNIPRGIFGGIFLIIILYMLINYAYVNVIGFEELKTSKNIAAIMASKVFGENAERILSILLFLGVLAYINALLLSNPRVMYAMVDDKILPPAFQKRNKKGALTVGLTVFAGISAFIVFFAKEFDTLLSFTIFLDSFGMALSAGAIFLLRRRTKHLDDTGIYKMKLYPLLPIIFIAAYSFVAISLLITQTRLSLIGLGVMAVFIVLYFSISSARKQRK
ncbi:MAG: APC family permease [Chitinophagaceae bacterium]|nr:MAG: APC family permease [Chitinophagaceae bacterium]